MKAEVLIWENDPLQGDFLLQLYQEGGYNTRCLSHYQPFRHAVMACLYRPQLLVLSIRVRTPLRKIPHLLKQAPLSNVLVISALQDLETELSAFAAGAGAYFVKPLQTQRVLAQSQALLAQSQRILKHSKQIQRGQVLHFGPLQLEPQALRVTLNQQKVILKTREFTLLYGLCRHANQLLSREALYQLLGQGELPAHARQLDNLILALRQKLPQSPACEIKTIYGQGYLLQLQCSA